MKGRRSTGLRRERSVEATSAALGAVLHPWREVEAGLERLLSGFGDLARVGLGLLVGWYVYVPAHELMHVLACRVAGGSVERVTIAPLWGGRLYERLLPIVDAESGPAGRLVDWDPGSDLVWWITDLGPYVPTLLFGVVALRLAVRSGSRLLFGAALPLALASFLGIPGDGYEMGALAIVRLPWFESPTWRELIVDDVFAALPGGGFAAGTSTMGHSVFVACAMGLAVVWAWSVWWLAVGVARLVRAARIEG